MFGGSDMEKACYISFSATKMKRTDVMLQYHKAEVRLSLFGVHVGASGEVFGSNFDGFKTFRRILELFSSENQAVLSVHTPFWWGFTPSRPSSSTWGTCPHWKARCSGSTMPLGGCRGGFLGPFGGLGWHFVARSASKVARGLLQEAQLAVLAVRQPGRGASELF